MVSNFQKILTFAFLLSTATSMAQEIRKESFLIPEKGIWGNNGLIQSDFTGITSWTLEYPNVKLKDSGDYSKTVTTSGGRFEVVDVEGEIIWKSELIDISDFKNIEINLTASETGSITNVELKYLKAYYKLDNSVEIPFSTNAINTGNWGSASANQKDINGKQLQVIIRLMNQYSSDKVILDEIIVSGEKQITQPPVPKYGIVLNEFMVDPSPAVGLPETEYIELFNTLANEVNLENWILRINGVEKKLQKATIPAGGILILCATGSLESLKPFGNAINVVGFQGLLNSSATVEILDPQKNLIDRVIYSDAWYKDLKKDDGGWSLEKIDPDRNCNQTENWQASLDANGGTPGKRNSAFRKNPDVNPPTIAWIAAVSDKQIDIGFSELMDSISLKNMANYKLVGGTVSGIELISMDYIRVIPGTPLVKDKTYLLEFENLTDDCGNKITKFSETVQWNIPEKGNLLINEILFNPIGNGEDYVEVYNNSQKIINLGNLYLATRDDSLKLKQVYPVSSKNRLLQPGNYLAITKDTNKVFPYYAIDCRTCFLQTDKMPSFNNDKGKVVLLDKEQNILDEFSYNERMHSEFLADLDGVSLERISLNEPANESGNWQSASSIAGFGTPGYKNSQAGVENLRNPKITFEPESFSPNGDGYNDMYSIHYQLQKPGCTGTVSVFDSAGRFVLFLTNNQLLGTDGTVKWNGENSFRQKLPLGVYVVMVEILDPSGKVYRFKDGVVLTGIME